MTDRLTRVGPARRWQPQSYYPRMTGVARSAYEALGLRGVRPYLIVGDANEAIDFYVEVFDAVELERHTTDAGGVGHVKLQVGETILEIGEHPDAAGREAEPLPRVGLRHYLADVDDTSPGRPPLAPPVTHRRSACLEHGPQRCMTPLA